MKEILYRGKSVADDKWYEGYYVITKDYLSGEEQPVIIPLGTELYSHGEVSMLEFVDPFTVGQFIGSVDANGRRIYEGDILKHKQFDSSSVYRVVIRDIREFGMLIRHPECYEIIGNVHDNPEMV